ncbi:unnamed protein product (macronuclear) [Paramecium tetraurelia]|uniref:Uncharacterized protein n=1 Tax=Paramecium tetraurelia TaxID=5888 RepID=A0D9Y2_PARTE|nr:uncharacterized protein GSPATT00014781001 [Paramecium tetraurelia]CAK79849.1 unnamed protein product [Paramecium tetraurelia]|eukprot:XP_001447246.1 hypothetical protein (macronuclear) [Paramecium tetraurelia strain d4-2]
MRQSRGRKIDTSNSESEIYQNLGPILNKPGNVQPQQKPKNQGKPKSQTQKKSQTNLKNQENKLTKKMKEYEKQISELRQQLQDDQANQQYINCFNSTKEQYEKLIQTYEETIHQLKQTELNLLEELQGQSEIARDALNKLYQYQQEYNTEQEELRQHYEQMMKEKELELTQKYELQLQQLENINQQSRISEPKIAQELSKKLKDMATKEELYLEEIEILKNKLNQKKSSVKEKELRQKLIDLELKLQDWDDNLERSKSLEYENQSLLCKVQQLEKQIQRKEEKERRLRDEWNKQYQDLQTEVKYWKNEMDKVIMENNLVLSKITPSKKKY